MLRSLWTRQARQSKGGSAVHKIDEDKNKNMRPTSLFVALAAGGGYAFTPPSRQQWADCAPSRSRSRLGGAIDRDSDGGGESRSESRRGTILAGLGGALSSFIGGRKADVAVGATVQSAGALLADFPMRR